MGSFSIIIVIAFVLVASVLGIAIIQKREQAKAKLRQQIAQYRYRANETGSILENFSAIPIGAETRGLLLQYIQLNLSAASRLAPTDSLIARNLSSIKEQLKNPQSNVDKQRLSIPKDSQQLNLLIKQLSKLGNYILRFKTIKAMSVDKVPVSVNKIMLLISEAKICAYIQQGQRSLAEHNYVNAQRHFQIAQQMLDKFKNKNSRLVSLEAELKELVNLTPQQAANKSLSIDTEESESAEAEQDNIFGPKKKW